MKNKNKWTSGGGEVPRAAHPVLHPYLKNALYSTPEAKTRDAVFGGTLSTLIDVGTTHQSQAAKLALRAWKYKNATVVCEGKA